VPDRDRTPAVGLFEQYALGKDSWPGRTPAEDRHLFLGPPDSLDRNTTASNPSTDRT
jgi:hypothetical protein